MRILVVGAGALGGYFGGRLLHAGRDVTFLVRPKRAAELASIGLAIKSPAGDIALTNPPTVLTENLREHFDLILLSCKAYDLAGAIESFAPAVGPNTAILPLLNGMSHLDVLDKRFGESQVLGGLAIIAATLNADRAIVHLNALHSITFGERAVGSSDRVRAIAAVVQGAGFDAIPSEQIVLEMWEKWVFLATLAAMTCLMRASIGDISAAPGGREVMLATLEECRSIAESAGYPPRSAPLERARTMLSTTGSALTASMLRDMEANSQIEADQIVGDLLRQKKPGSSSDLSPLRIAYTHLKSYEARRTRTIG